MRSLLAPLVIGLVLSLAAIFGVQWTVVRVAIDEVMEDYVADELVQDAEELFSALTTLPEGGAVLGLQHFDPVFLSPASGRYYQILVNGRVAFGLPRWSICRCRSSRSPPAAAGSTRPPGRMPRNCCSARPAMSARAARSRSRSPPT
ncbi:MAG: hypothetical protein IPM01_16925 [Burkholderiaceae bacterium]|nr:hypothetical protein [Burkholderiaceae bacterium]